MTKRRARSLLDLLQSSSIHCQLRWVVHWPEMGLLSVVLRHGRARIGRVKIYFVPLLLMTAVGVKDIILPFDATINSSNCDGLVGRIGIGRGSGRRLAHS